MKKIATAALAAALLVPAVGFGQISCTRGGLDHAVELYIDAQTNGDRSGLPLAQGLGYMENMAPADISEGLINTPMRIDPNSVLPTRYNGCRYS